MTCRCCQELAGLFGGQHRGLAAFDDVLGAAHGWAGLVATTWPVTSQSNSMRMAARCCLTVGSKCLPERLDVGGDVHRLDVGDLAELVLVAPGEEPADGAVVGHARVRVADGGGEEFDEAARGLVAGIGDQRGTTTPWRPATLFSGRDRAGTRAFDWRSDSMALSVT